MSRIETKFAELKRQGRAALVTFVTAGDPDPVTADAILAGLPAAGADLIELGMPFTDPMADGPAIQAASLRALKAGMTLEGVLKAVRMFRTRDTQTPIVLMGYYNPIYAMGVEKFCASAQAAGVDGLIVVDLPPEEADELYLPAKARGIDFIVLTAPTTDNARLPHVLARASGFVYYVSIAGITGTRAASGMQIAAAVTRLRQHTRLPVAVGFGIRSPGQAAQVAGIADGAVVGSAIVGAIAGGLDANGKAKPGLIAAVHGQVRELAAGVRGAKDAELAGGRR